MFIQKSPSFKDRSKFIAAVRNGYEICNQVTKQHDVLNWIVGKQYLPHLKNIAIEYSFMKMIEEKRLLGYTWDIKPNRRKNCVHLEIESQDIIMTISQVANELVVPKHACFRSDLSMKYSTLPLFPEDDENLSKIYTLITHGHGGVSPNFINYGVPMHGVIGWLNVVDILKLPHEVEKNDEVVVGEEDIIKMIEFKDEIEKTGVRK